MTEWSRCSPWIAAALEHSIGGWSLADVRGRIDSGEATFWPGERSAAVSQVTDYPKGRVLEVVLAGGDGDELLERTLPQVEAEARAFGCVEIHVVGRLGWNRRLKPCGFAPLYTVTRKEL